MMLSLVLIEGQNVSTETLRSVSLHLHKFQALPEY